MSNANASPFRRWLRRQPQPVSFRCDGQAVAVALGPNQWAVTEASIRALAPARVEALDAKGVCLRATTMLAQEASGDDDAEAPAAKSELVELAKLIAEAHDAGARRHAEAYALAFSENTRLVQLLATRLSGLETAWQRAMQQTAQAHADAIAAQAAASAAANGEDPAGAAVASMLASALATQQQRPATNGTAAKGGK